MMEIQWKLSYALVVSRCGATTEKGQRSYRDVIVQRTQREQRPVGHRGELLHIHPSVCPSLSSHPGSPAQDEAIWEAF